VVRVAGASLTTAPIHWSTLDAASMSASMSACYDLCMKQRLFPVVLIAILFTLAGCDAAPPLGFEPSTQWPTVGNDRGNMRYSPIERINKDNVDKLEIAWTYSTGELANHRPKHIECTPIVVDGVLYLTTAYLKVVALDAATGEALWSFDPMPTKRPGVRLASGGVNRGCAYWSDGEPDGQRRVIHGTADGRLFSLDAATGELDPRFADAGVLDLRKGLGEGYERVPYGPTSAVGICGDRIILGVSNGEHAGVAAPGDIRAFDIRTGEETWRFRTNPQKSEFGFDTWPSEQATQNRGGANAWSGVSIDPVRQWVFVGLGSASYDFYGADRLGDNLFANCVLVLDANTGERVWHYQTLRHDLWDHDLPTYPNLITLQRKGKTIDAVAQVTKTGYVFVFDRETGEPLFDVADVPAPASNVPGEKASKTQPIPTAPPPFAMTTITEDDLATRTPEIEEWAREQYQKAKSRHFEPPRLEPYFITPGTLGGANWSGASFDPETGLLFVNSNNLPNLVRLIENKNNNFPLPYHIGGYWRFLAPDGYPGIKPPWGQLTALNLNKGTIAWQVTLGHIKDMEKHGLEHTGAMSLGGTIVTKGGLVFIAGTADEMIRAYDKDTGELLWEHELPAGGYATPCTYEVDGKQYVVIAAAGAGKVGTKPGDQFVAFALPE
jgi:quinoprotein glucose dehydrogenase